MADASLSSMRCWIACFSGLAPLLSPDIMRRMTEQENQLLIRFKSLLQRKLRRPQLVAFGSRARGDAEADSDLDVLVLSEESESSVRTFVSDCAWEAGLGSGIVISPVLVPQREWQNGLESASLLAQAVRREGIAL